MMRTAVLAALALSCLAPLAFAADAPGSVLAHDVYFTLKDASPAAKAALVAACRKYLAGHDGAVFFAAGTRADEMTRDVNDRGYDVSLHVYFKNKAAHDAYQDNPRHKQFIDENSANWKAVRVFDSWVEATR
jgi:hypothetical protein